MKSALASQYWPSDAWIRGRRTRTPASDPRRFALPAAPGLCLALLLLALTAALLLAIGIIIEAAVSFVGLGVQPPTPSWGNMLSGGRDYLISGEWWLSVFPGGAISLTVVAFNLLGDGLRDRFDPRHGTGMGYAT